MSGKKFAEIQCNVLKCNGKIFPIIIVMHECKNTCSSCDKIMIKVENSLVDDTCVRVGVLIDSGGCGFNWH